MKKTPYILVHRITRRHIETGHVFDSMTGGAMHILMHDLHADCVPAEVDLFGHVIHEAAPARLTAADGHPF